MSLYFFALDGILDKIYSIEQVTVLSTSKRLVFVKKSIPLVLILCWPIVDREATHVAL